MRSRITGTFDGDALFQGSEPDGVSLDIQGCDVVTVRDGRLVDIQANINGTELARQLGRCRPRGRWPRER